MTNFTYTIKGLNNLLSTLEKAGTEMPEEFRRAMLISVSAVKQTAQELVPVRKGDLQKSIVEVVQTNPLIGTVSVGQPYGKYVELGTKAHVIKAKNAKSLFFMFNGDETMVKLVHHPGTKAKPFMKPALNQNIATIQNNFLRAAEAALSRIKGA